MGYKYTLILISYGYTHYTHPSTIGKSYVVLEVHELGDMLRRITNITL